MDDNYQDDITHCDFKKIYQGIYENYWFSSMRKRIYDHLDNYIIYISR